MSFRDFSAAELEEGGLQDPLAIHLEELADAAFGEAIDAAAALRVDFDKNGPFSLYIKDCKRELIDKLMVLDDLAPTDVVSVMAIQLAIRNFKSAIGFAHKLIDGYSPPSTSDSDEPS